MDYSNYYLSSTIRSVFEVSFASTLVETMMNGNLDTSVVYITHGKVSKSGITLSGHDST